MNYEAKLMARSPCHSCPGRPADVGNALAVRFNARAASAIDPRAGYLAPLTRCALLPTLPRRRCTPPSTPEQIRWALPLTAVILD